ncbi:MAG: fimbria/pilus periplasmic chaperone [Escherichia coli]|nr:fimbria/pilus periplasmic chaperone [Escherichia coli]
MKCIIGNKKWVCGFRDELKVSQNIIRSGILFLLSILFINNASAGGFGLGVTRLIYPAESKQMLPTRKEASLRIMFLGKTNLPTDRETLYWMNVKAIPPTDEKNTQKNTLQLALQNKIKLFYRPENLPVQPGKARNMLRFKYEGKQLKVINPSPYYLTLTGIKVQGSKLPNMFVPPKSDITVSSPVTLAGEITYQTINDFGATTERQKGIMQ